MYSFVKCDFNTGFHLSPCEKENVNDAEEIVVF